MRQFLLNPEEELYVRELTRLLDEQINSVRRELDNLKKIGLLKSRTKNRKKFYLVNPQFLLFNELRSIFLKTSEGTEDLVKQIQKMGEVDYLLVSGFFVKKPESPIDLLIVGEIDKTKLEAYLDQLNAEAPIRFSLLTKKDFLYRVECQDPFVLKLMNDKSNIEAFNQLEIDL